MSSENVFKTQLLLVVHSFMILKQYAYSIEDVLIICLWLKDGSISHM